MKALVPHTIGILLITVLALMPADGLAQKRKHQKKGSPPVWATAHGHRAKQATVQTVRYVYNPEYNIYYDRQQEVYLYVHTGRWVVSAGLPISLNNRDVRDGFSVELSGITTRPYSANATHIKRYRKYAKRRYLACYE